MRLLVRTKLVKLNRVNFMYKASHNLVSVLGLCDDGHRILFTKTSYIMNNKTSLVGVDKHPSEMYVLELQMDGEHALAPAEHGNGGLDVWHASLAHASCETCK